MDLSIPQFINSNRLRIKGSIGEKQYIEITVNDNHVVKVTGNNNKFEKEIELKEGINKLSVVFKNGKSESRNTEYTVNVDTAAPNIVLYGIDRDIFTTDKQWLPIQGYINEGVDYVEINGERLVSGEFNTAFGKVVELAPGENVFRIETKDYAGNINTRVLKVYRR